ncbi:hypothetical protein IMSAGC018_00863 [Lachnospiraceae bacterium]|nr:hypothetical protein IMSAGC018_00863 [Lachnospiraceae bacterium]
MERYLQIEKINLKYNIPLHILICLLMLLVSPLLMGVANLGAKDTAKVLEMYAALIGIVLVPPVFLPEQDHDIRDLVYTKYTNGAIVYLVRIFGNILLLSVLLGIYVGILAHNGCEFPIGRYFLGTLAEMLFMGGLGLFFYGLCDNLVIGYMAPLIYYITAMGSGDKYLKILYPFSMARGSYDEKICLAVGAFVLLGAGVWCRCRRK